VTGRLSDWFSRQLIGLHLLAVLAVVVCVLMGLWQLGVYGAKHEDESAAVRNRAPVELLKVWGPDAPFTADLVDRRVRIHGRFPPDRFFTVNRPDGQSWLAATVPVDGTTSAIVVILGHTPDPPSIDRHLPRRSVFTAVLQPSEPSGDLSMAKRVNESHQDLFSGYALLDDPHFTAFKPVEIADPEVSWTVGLRNLAYALQWWVFGLFAVFMWWRMSSDLVAVRRTTTDETVP
jgi:surfeit locus 1 family protein